VQFVGKPGFEALLGGVCGSDDGNIFVPCRRFGLCNCALDAVRSRRSSVPKLRRSMIEGIQETAYWMRIIFLADWFVYTTP